MSTDRPSEENDESIRPGQDPQEQRQLPADDVDKQIEDVAEGYLDQLRRGAAASIEQLVKEHPELAPELENRLKFYRTVFKATHEPDLTVDQRSLPTVDFSGDSSATQFHREIAVRISCPHCGNRLQLVEDAVEEVTCTSCGSSIRVGSRTSHGGLPFVRPATPKQLGHFRIERVLGEGGFGIVYLAEDLHLDNRPVALKIPRHGFFATVEEERRFFREARNAARLRHPHIAQIYEVSEDRNTPFIVSEFIDGRTLRELAKEVVLSHREIVELMIQVIDAIDFAHRNKIIHRDLKTSNVLVDHQNQVYVVDFGLSRKEDVEITMTIDGAVLGTVQYMSPEQAAGNQSEVRACSDIYSLGVILYELLCNELPFHGTKRMMITQVMSDEPRNPRSLNDNVPRDLETITLKAMAKNPRQRYTSAREFGDDLRRWLRGEPILARPIGRMARCLRWCQRHPTVAILGSAIAALLLLSTTLASLWAIDQSFAKKAEETARRQIEQRQFDLLTQNGLAALEGNQLPSAAMWFSEALALRDDRISRVRIGMIQDQIPKLTQLWSLDATVDRLTFNDSGTRLGAAAWTGQVHIYDTMSQAPLFAKKLRPFSHFNLSPNGTSFAVCGKENQAQLWDVADGRLVHELAHTDIVVSTDFDSSGASIATGSFDSYARVWSVIDGAMQAEHKFDGLHVNRVAFVPGSTMVVVVTNAAGQVGNEIHLWEPASDRILDTEMLHADHVQTIAFADEGQKICSASRDGKLRIWEALSGQPIGDGVQLPFVPSQILFDGVSTQVAITISYEFDVQRWDLDSGKPAGRAIRGLYGYSAAAIEASNRLLALGSADGCVRIYDQLTGQQVCSAVRNGEIASALSFHPDGHRLAVGGSNGLVQLWDLAGASTNSLVFEHKDAVRNAIFSHDGLRCLTIGLDGKAFLWDAGNANKLATMEHSAGISECAISSNGDWFATAGNDQVVKLWDAYSGQQLGTDLAHDSPVAVLAFSPDSRYLATGCNDGSVACWETSSVVASAADGDAAQPLFVDKEAARIMSVAFGPRSDLFATAALDGRIQCWHPVSGKLPMDFFEHQQAAYDLAFLPDGLHLISCGSDGSGFVWQLAQKKLAGRILCAGTVRSVKLFDDGARCVTSESKGRVRLWQNLTQQFPLETAVQNPAIETVFYAEVNADASLLAFCGGLEAQGEGRPQTGAAVLYDLNTLLPLGPPLPHGALVRRVHFDPQGGRMLTASADHTAKLWTMDATPLPLTDAIRLARLLAQVEQTADGGLRATKPALQIAEFAELSEMYPNLFRCDAGEIERWTDDTRRRQELHVENSTLSQTR